MRLLALSKHNAEAKKQEGVAKIEGGGGENLKFSGKKFKFAGEKNKIHKWIERRSSRAWEEVAAACLWMYWLMGPMRAAVGLMRAEKKTFL